MDLGLRGRRAVVTGGTRGIGRAIAQGLAAEGCDVAVCARHAVQVEAVASELRETGVRAVGRAVDVTDADALRAFVSEAAAELGGLDVFVANPSAAMTGGNDEQAWRDGFEVDVLGVVRGCEAALPHLVQSGAGAIVIVGTVGSVEPIGSRRAYGSVKAALLPYAKSLARDLASKNVRCNVVSPGTIWFEGGVWNAIEKNAPDRYRAVLSMNPMGRMGTPEEVADAAVFLASPRASFISGANLVVDGARSQRVHF